MFDKIIFRLVCKARRWLYRHLSTNKSIGGIKSVQPVQLVGEGKILVEKSVTIGYFPSPHFFHLIVIWKRIQRMQKFL